MGDVYLAHDQRLEREVAVKVVPPDVVADRSIRKRLHREARALSRLNHPNIESLIDFDTESEIEFLVVEYIAGKTLSDMLGSGPLLEKEVARLGAQLASGLAAAHSQGVIHRDLKPGNLRVTSDRWLKILDFGIAKVTKPPGGGVGDSTTVSSSGDLAVVGTLPYMAPEQLRSQPGDARSDIYSAGAVLYEMATGQRPFRDEPAPALIDAILNIQPVPPRALNARVSPEMERIILKCLQKDPENRYHSAQDLEVDLRQLALPETGKPVLPSGGRGAARFFGRHGKILRLRWVLLLAVGLAAAAISLNLGGVRDWLMRGGIPLHIQSIAVLPLANFSGDPQQDYFADGVTDQLITNLAQIGAFDRVISRTSMMQYKHTPKPLRQIARELNVDAVVEGSVNREGNRVRISATLIQGTTEKPLWSRSYERDERDVLKLQADVASAIATEIEVAVTPQERERLTSAPPVVPAAYDAYLKGRDHWSKGTEQDWAAALQYFEQAVKIDPNYAPAYAGLADYYWATDALPPSVAMPKAEQYALKALEIDPTLAEALTSLGNVRFFADWKWPEAERDFKHALELAPGNAEAHRMYSAFLTATGRAEEALAESRRAQELDPLSVSAQVTIGWTFYYARRYDQAIAQCGKILDADPNSVGGHDCLGLSYLAKGAYEKAIEESQKAVSLSGRDLTPVVGLARANALAGNAAAARRVLEELRERAKRRYVPPSFFAEIHVALGEKKQGLEWLERASVERDAYLARLKVEPAFDPIRSDPGFQNLMARLGL
jgi:serine/threonine-protein kinase